MRGPVVALGGIAHLRRLQVDGVLFLKLHVRHFGWADARERLVHQ